MHGYVTDDIIIKHNMYFRLLVFLFLLLKSLVIYLSNHRMVI